MDILKQSTTVTILMGPFIDPDGVSEETALTPVFEISKNNAAFAARNSATAVSHVSEGWYSVELDTTDTGTLGRLIVKAQDSANHVPVWREFYVVPSHVYDGLVAGTDFLQTDAQLVGGATPDDKNDVADQVWEEAVADHSATAGSTAEEIASHATSAEIVALNDPTAAAIADAVLEELIADHSGVAGSLAEAASRLDALISSRSSHSAADAASQVWGVQSVEPSAVPQLGTADLQKIVEWIGMMMLHKVTETATQQAIRDSGDTTNIGTASVSDDGTTAIRGKFN